MRGGVDGSPSHEVALEAMPKILGCHRLILCQRRAPGPSYWRSLIRVTLLRADLTPGAGEGIGDRLAGVAGWLVAGRIGKGLYCFGGPLRGRPVPQSLDGHIANGDDGVAQPGPDKIPAAAWEEESSTSSRRQISSAHPLPAAPDTAGRR